MGGGQIPPSPLSHIGNFLFLDRTYILKDHINVRHDTLIKQDQDPAGIQGGQ